MTLGSLFDGIAGFPLAAERQAIKTIWTSEIEANCTDIAKRHFPDAEVKRFCPVPEIRHKEWKKRGLMPSMKPEETPEFSFSDLQMTLYNTIYI